MKLSHKQVKQSGLREKRERGFMLLEVLVSVLLFALGIVALVGLQARSLGATDDAQYRAEATHLANAYMAQIWASGLQGNALATAFQTSGTQWNAFRDQVVGGKDADGNDIPGIPGGQSPDVQVSDRTLTFTPTGSATSVTVFGADVTITISWLDRLEKDKDGNALRHRYVQTSSVGY